MKSIYLDHAATTPMHPEVIRVITEVMTQEFGNPSSIHAFGRSARKVVDDARRTLASMIEAEPTEVVFTSGGTEAINAVIRHVAQAGRGNHIIASAIEHPATLEALRSLSGFEVTFLPVDEFGRVSVKSVEQALRPETVLVTIMMVNNEVGTIQPIAEIGQLLVDHPAYFHSDAVQAFGKLPISVKNLGVDYMTIAAHKINGPKGVGFLYVKKTAGISPLQFGGSQERKRRAGTENVPGIAGFAKAASLYQENYPQIIQHYTELKSILSQSLNGIINTPTTGAAPHILNVSFPGVRVEALLTNLDMAGIAVSSGSACTAGSIEPSHVLSAMFGVESERTKTAIRFSIGPTNTVEEVRFAAEKTNELVARLTGEE